MIRLEHVSVKRMGVPVLTDISMEIPRGSFIGIIGKNGSGKSTLYRAMAGLLPYEGEIWIDDRNLKEMGRRERAGKMSLLAQSPGSPAMTVRTLVSHGRFPHMGFSKILTERDQEAVDQAMRLIGIEHLQDRYLQSLSGGERQKAYLAMNTAQDTDCLLLDEPTTYLDIAAQQEILFLAKKLNEKGKTILLTSHDLPCAFTFAAKIYLLDKGYLIAEGKPKELCHHPEINRVFQVHLAPENASDCLFAYKLLK